MNNNDIPVTWIREQIKKNSGMYAAAWNRLLDLWNHYILYGDDNGEKVQDDYIRMHKDPTAAQKFWRNE